MSKKKHRRGQRAAASGRPSPPRPAARSEQVWRVPAEFAEVQSLMRRKRWAEASRLLRSLDLRHPHNPAILTELVNACYELKDMRGYLEACQRLVRLTPDDPDLTLGLAGAHMTNLHPFLARRTFRRFLERWPEHPRAAQVRSTLANLDQRLPVLLDELGFTGEPDALDLAALHEEALSSVELGHLADARRAAEALLRRRPEFVAGLNNLSQILAAEGRLAEAIAIEERALALEPGNVHALSNLARYLVLSGRLEPAREVAERLNTVETTRPDRWVKQAEALSCLGDDQGVQDVFARAEQAGDPTRRPADPLLFHLAAVAALRLGREDEARRRWQQALQLAPGMEVAQANLDDLRKPPEERHAPWPFPLGNWLPASLLRDLLAPLEAAAKRGTDEAVTRAMRRALREHPAIAALVPPLLDRGDPQGREFALRIALMAETPELLAALRDFALGQRGPLTLRNQAAQKAVEAGLLPPGPVRLWVGDEWREMLLLNFEIHGEPVVRHEPRAEAWLGQAMAALKAGDAERAEPLLTRALEVEPDSPVLHFNLASAYVLQGRELEAELALRRIHERHPDYLFARTGLAKLHARRGEYDEARGLLDPLLTRPRLHFSEYSALCSAYIDLHLAQDNGAAARAWLGMWQQVEPDNPAIAEYERRIGPGRHRHWLPRPLRGGLPSTR